MNSDTKIRSLLGAIQLASDVPNEPAWRELRLSKYAIEELERENNELREAVKKCAVALNALNTPETTQRLPYDNLEMIGKALALPAVQQALKEGE